MAIFQGSYLRNAPRVSWTRLLILLLANGKYYQGKSISRHCEGTCAMILPHKNALICGADLWVIQLTCHCRGRARSRPTRLQQAGALTSAGFLLSYDNTCYWLRFYGGI